MSGRAGLLDRARGGIRRLQLIVGVGFFSLVSGSVASAYVIHGMAPRLAPLGPTLATVLVIIVREVWALGVLPAVCYAVARVVALAPWPTALGAFAVGEIASLVVESISGSPELGGVGWSTRAACGVGAVLLTATAVRRARRAAGHAEDRAREAAEAKAKEYEAFVR